MDITPLTEKGYVVLAEHMYVLTIIAHLVGIFCRISDSVIEYPVNEVRRNWHGFYSVDRLMSARIEVGCTCRATTHFSVRHKQTGGVVRHLIPSSKTFALANPFTLGAVYVFRTQTRVEEVRVLFHVTTSARPDTVVVEWRLSRENANRIKTQRDS